MNVDPVKTGALIASARKELCMTQKELAKSLHISDRTISKWERGAGFPDVGLLEPLAQALHLNVLDLLHGERTEAETAEAAVTETLSTVQQIHRRKRRKIWSLLAQGAAGLLLVWCLSGLFGVILLPADKTVTAGVYRNGIQRETTMVRWDGVIRYRLPWRWEYQGRVQVPLSPVSMNDGHDVTLTIPLERDGSSVVTHQSWYGNVKSEEGPFVQNKFCLTASLTEFAFQLSDGTVVATSPAAYDKYAAAFTLPPLPTMD